MPEGIVRVPSPVCEASPPRHGRTKRARFARPSLYMDARRTASSFGGHPRLWTAGLRPALAPVLAGERGCEFLMACARSP
jgi:hypothetical protein